MPNRAEVPRTVLFPARVLALLSFALLTGCGGAPGGPDAPPLSSEERLALPADAASGARLSRICRTCHEVQKGTGHRVGPNLWGVTGARPARHKDFAYSQALTRADFVWDEAALDAYLANPQRVVPGGRMAYAGMPDPADRRDVIAYLATLQD